MATPNSSAIITLFGVNVNVYALFIIGLFSFFLYLLFKAQKDKRLDWVDIITKDGQRVSLTKILNLIGGIIATWIVVQLALDGNLDWEIFVAYLTYVASIEGFSKFVQAKYNRHGSGRPGGNNYGGYDSYGAHYPDFGSGYGRSQNRRRTRQYEDNVDRRSRGAAKTPLDEDLE